MRIARLLALIPLFIPVVLYSPSSTAQSLEYSSLQYTYNGASFFQSLSPIEVAIRRCMNAGGFKEMESLPASNYGYPNYFVICNNFLSPNEIFVTTYCPFGWNKGSDYCFRYSNQTEPGTDSGTPSCDAASGNPINLATGRKYQHEEDYVSSANPLLRFDRYYNNFHHVVVRNDEPLIQKAVF